MESELNRVKTSTACGVVSTHQPPPSSEGHRVSYSPTDVNMTSPTRSDAIKLLLLKPDHIHLSSTGSQCQPIERALPEL